MLGVLAVVAVLALGIAIAYLSYLAERKRREALQRFAASRGWTYVEQDDSLVHRFDGAPFGRGHGRRATNVLRGEHDGRPVVVFEYRYQETHSNGNKGTRTVTYRFTVYAVELGVRTPGLVIDPENMLERFAGRLLGSDIELESEEFNRAFRVNSPDRRFASAVLHPRMMEHLLRFRETAWRLEDDAMLLVEDGRYDPAGVDARLGMMDSVLDLVPEFVWQDLRGGQA